MLYKNIVAVVVMVGGLQVSHVVNAVSKKVVKAAYKNAHAKKATQRCKNGRCGLKKRK